MPRAFPEVPQEQYRPRWIGLEHYERVESVPDGMTWRPAFGPGDARFTMLCTIGDYYRLIRNRVSGEIAYYKRKHDDDAKSPAEKIDAEPTPRQQARFHTGSFAWFVDIHNRWHCVEVVRRTDNRITIRSATGWDAERVAPWPYPGELEFPTTPRFMQRLRKLKERNR